MSLHASPDCNFAALCIKLLELNNVDRRALAHKWLGWFGQRSSIANLSYS